MKKGVIIGIIAAVAVILIAGILFLLRPPVPADNSPGGGDEIIEDTIESLTWKAKGVALGGSYADAEIVNLGGSYRMYYSPEPEVAGFKGQLYSAVSSDGITWTAEAGTRKEWATFPSVIKLDNGKYRLYYQNDGKIKSALSSDGLTWTEESGTRIDAANNLGLAFENVAAPTVMKIGNEYVMVYRGTINEKYSAEQVPNSNTQLFLWAVSTDGLTFEKKGIAIDSRDSTFKGLLDGCEFVQWDDGTARLYFWSYSGVYHAIFSSNIFSDEEFDFSTSSNPQEKFPSNPPGDPTLMKINGKWFMYYGQHTQGIYYAILD